jgi:hypothetical protein
MQGDIIQLVVCKGIIYGLSYNYKVKLLADEMEVISQYLWIWHGFFYNVNCSFSLVNGHSCLNPLCDNQLIFVHLGIILNYC